MKSSHVVSCRVIIDREEIENCYFQINIIQKVAQHDTFEIICPTHALEAKGAYPLTDSRDYLGKQITVKFIQFAEEIYSFTGFITDIANAKGIQTTNSVVLTGYSPTILLDQGLHCQSFEKSTIKTIIQQTTSDFPQNFVNFNIRPNYDSEIPYSVQYKETHFEYIKRLAVQYGEWFYYDGSKIVLGSVPEEIISLEEVSEMFEYKLRMRLVPQNFAYLAYQANTAKDITESTNATEKKSYGNDFVEDGIKYSNKFYQTEPRTHYNNSLLENGSSELRNVVQLQKNRRANVFYLEGKSTKPSLRVGALIKVAAYLKSNYENLVPLETYRIVSIKKNFNGKGLYENSFEAVPYEITVPDYMNEDAVPTCQTQSAIVVDNNDPKGMSRIRVQFPWQKQGISQKTPWIRVVTPYAGSGKGHHWLPEIGEEVLVGFENDNAEKPFVLGAMYNGTGKSGHGGMGNFIKSFETATGIKLVMNDQEKSFLLEDPSGNTVFADGKGNMTLTAPKNMTLNVGEDLNISVGKNKTVTVGSNMETQVGEDKTTTVTKKNSLQANEYKQDIDGNKTVTIGGNLDEKTASTTHKSSGDVLMKSGGVFKGLGATDAKVNKG
jgi:type VI secretion system secreted protein VgrG